MNNFLILGRISVISVWAIFWLSVLIIRLVKENEFKTAFAGIKKMLSAVIELFIFFTFFNFLLWINPLSNMGSFPINWVYISSFIGYALLLTGFVMAMKVAWTFGKPLSMAMTKNNLFRHTRNLAYLAFLLIAIGSPFIFMDKISLAIAIVFLIPLLIYRIKVENKANLNI